ncbi:MAG: hypothetical protein LBM96_01875 [Methanobrevibacter sp.]|jgi:hypothetical protein|nr:hypothetical protein [Candidatus Methanoflexus mossambicus]
MDSTSLKEKFHDLDRKVSSKFHKKDKLTGAKKISRGRVFILFLALIIIAFSVFIIVAGLSYEAEPLEQTSLTLNTEIADIGNKTNFTIHGQTDIGASVKISSEELKLSSVTVKVDKNGKFKYTVNIPEDIDSAFVYVSAESEDRNSTNKSVYITRGVVDNEITESIESAEPTPTANIDFDGNGVVEFVDSGLTTGNFMYLNVKTSDGVKELATSTMFEGKVKEGDSVYFRYTGTYMNDGIGGKYPVVVLYNKDSTLFGGV